MSTTSLLIGWAQTDITPRELPVLITGQFHFRLSEGVADPLTATACCIERDGERVVFVSCDLICISRDLARAVKERLKGTEIDPSQVILNATHTHAGPETRITSALPADEFNLGEASVSGYVAYAADQIVNAITEAWRSRKTGGIAYGLDYAVIGRNRRWVDDQGRSIMYGLKNEAIERFRHIEGYEDHSLNLLATYDSEGRLTGLIVNVPCPSQEEEQIFQLSADFWHETRLELRERFGKELFILPQVSAAGELTSHLIYENAAAERMARLRGRTLRQEVAVRIADAVGRILPAIQNAVEYTPVLKHRMEEVQIPANRLTQAAADEAESMAKECEAAYRKERERLEANPELKKEPRWYCTLTGLYQRARWYRGVVDRFKAGVSFFPEEVHFVRLGDIAFATNPYEYYLDFGIQIKVKSPAIQTFLVQLAGNGSYVPSPRSVAGGGYGSVPASNPVGPEGGQALADHSVQALRALWKC